MGAELHSLGLCFAAALMGLGCEVDPIRVQFLTDGIGDRQEGRGFGEPSERGDAAPGGGQEPEAFIIGPDCLDFPEPCEWEQTPRCSLVNNNPGFRAACVSPGGTQEAGQACERGERGDDDCVDGTFCSLIGVGFESGDSLLCRTLCDENADCPAGLGCIQLTGAQGLGLCVERCLPFEESCGDSSLRCAVARDVSEAYFGYCERFGARLDGEPCVTSAQCGEAYGCELSAGVCRELCDSEHPCEAGLRCLPLALGDASGPRLCLP